MGIKNSKFRTRKYALSCLVLGFSFLLFTNCSFHKEISAPPDLIPADSMEHIITDLTITEAAINSGIPNDSLKRINVLADYKISRQRFDSSFTYYSKNPQKLKDIYAKVLEDLNQK